MPPAAHPPVRWLTIKPTQFGGIMIREAAAFEPTPRAHAREGIKADLLAEIRTAVAACHLSNPLRAVTSDKPSWTASELARMVGRDPTNKTVARALDELVDKGRLERGEDKRYLPGPALDDDEQTEEET